MRSNETGWQGCLSEKMRLEWDRRIQHDYRYWMSDGVDCDRDMWEVGERDFSIISAGLDFGAIREQTAFELGCGVGRILRAAAKRFKRVLGVDVSSEAIATAKHLLEDQKNVELLLTNGVDLSAIESESVDFAYSFATLGSLPTVVFCNYMVELSRVVRKGGRVHIQLYLGREHVEYEEDTLSLRSYDKERFVSVLRGLGLAVSDVSEMILPFEISDKEAGIVATMVKLIREAAPSISPEEMQGVLLESSEGSFGSTWKGSRTEYLMALSRAQQHMDVGRLAEAEECLVYAIEHYGDAEDDIKELLSEIRNKAHGEIEFPANISEGEVSSKSGEGKAEPVSKISVESPSAEVSDSASGYYERNLRVLRDRFPEIADLLESVEVSGEVSVRPSKDELPVIYRGALALDNVSNPRRAAEVWAERILNGRRVGLADSLIVTGFGCAYHLEELQRCCEKEIYAIEPNPEVLKAALEARDCVDVLTRLDGLSCSIELLRTYLSSRSNARTTVVVHPQTQAVAGSFVDEVRTSLMSEHVFSELQPSIGVVSPIYGGSLPIAGYTAMALKSLHQRVTVYDLGDFYKGFKKMKDLVKDKYRVNFLEGAYVEMLSKVVLEAVTERPVDILICLAQAPMCPDVLTELRNRGVITVMWFVEDCRRFPTWQLIARYYDYMFLIQRDEFIAKVEQAGAGRAIYLPVGCEPSIHRPLELTPEDYEKYSSDVSFVGAGYNNRRQMFGHLASDSFKIWGTEWPDCLPFTRMVQNEGKRVTPAEYVKVFNATKVNLNLHSSTERDGVEPDGDFVNPRTFELASAGAFQLTDNRKLLSENFEVGKEIATFENQSEMEDAIEYYLANPKERLEMASAARLRATRDHTYEKRLRRMLEYIYADHYEDLSMRIAASPWPKTLEAAEAYPELKNRLEAAFQRGDEPELDSLISDIQTGKGSLTETEQILLFLHHIRKQISYVRKLRKED